MQTETTENRRLEPGKLVLASHNKGKLREIQDMLAPHGFEVLSAGDLDLPEPVKMAIRLKPTQQLRPSPQQRLPDCQLFQTTAACVLTA